MLWKQFFTPMKSLDAPKAKHYMEENASDSFTLLDVRQPKEYEQGHIAGAKLIPLPELSDRLAEIDPAKPTIVYWAVGGRSRVAAQMLAGKGFKEVYNLSGGIKAWHGERAIGPEDLGLPLFTGQESPTETLIVAYGLEQGLREFYLSMVDRVTNDRARCLFQKLADIEVKHQKRLFEEYRRIADDAVAQADFAQDTVAPAAEGGLTTEEYVRRFQPDLNSAVEVVSLAMSIEAQALDLYQRAADRSESTASRQMLIQIADEERAHLKQLGDLLEHI